MKPFSLMCLMIPLVLSAVPAFADATHADPHAPKVNGDSKSDLAPLATGKAETTPLDNANFPPPGGATMGAGPNPRETGTIDADKAGKK